MKIAFISHYFPPEMGAPSARVYEMTKRWAKSGQEVNVITCFPNHPTGVIPDEYKGRFFLKEEIDGINVYRNYVYATPNKGFLKRIISYLSFMFSSVLISMKKIKNPDVIIATSPQFFTLPASYIYSRI